MHRASGRFSLWREGLCPPVLGLQQAEDLLLAKSPAPPKRYPGETKMQPGLQSLRSKPIGPQKQQGAAQRFFVNKYQPLSFVFLKEKKKK